MATFPATLPTPSGESGDFKEKYLRKTRRSDFDAGYEQTRPMWTKTRREFHIEWRALTATQVSTLITFFEGSDVEYGGYAFDWTHPVSSTTYSVRLVDDEVDVDYVANDKYRVKIRLRQV